VQEISEGKNYASKYDVVTSCGFVSNAKMYYYYWFWSGGS